MATTLKLWTRLGVGLALATGPLAACSPEPEAAPDATPVAAPDTPAPGPLTSAGEGEGGGGGEGGEGEGGVSIAAAYSDPVVYRSALAIAAAHALAARDAFAAGEREAAAEMFAHPVSEVLADLAPVLEARGVEDFTALFIETSGAVFDGADAASIAQRTDAILSALDEAALSAPGDGRTAGTVAAGIAADQIERAADMYRAALQSGRYEPYLDGYGFYQAASRVMASDGARIAADNPEAAEAINAALGVLAEAYPDAAPRETLDADPAALTVAASRVVLSVAP